MNTHNEIITLAKFRASCRLINDLREITQQTDDTNVRAYVYIGGTTIVITAENKLHLIIEREEWLYDNTPAALAELEVRLYEFADGEYFNYGRNMLAFQCEGFSDLSSDAKGIFTNVITAMQEAEEMGFNGRDYLNLMQAIAIEAAKRAQEFQAQSSDPADMALAFAADSPLVQLGLLSEHGIVIGD